MKVPRASIIVPTYNAANLISTTLDSILAQTFTDFECLVIDDGSTDGSADVVNTYKDSRIKLIRQKNSGEPAGPRNVGLKHSLGEYIFIFDSDDVMAPDKLTKSIAALDAHPNADLLFTNFSSIDEKENVINPDFLSSYDRAWKMLQQADQDGGVYFLAAKDVYAELAHANFIGTSSVALRASNVRNKYFFDESLANADDYLFWMTFLKSHNAIYLNASLHHYRVHRNSISKRSYLKRGPSRLKAIQKAKADCEDKALRKVLSKRLAKEYALMAYAYRKEEQNYEEQQRYSLKSLNEKLGMKATKLLVQSIVYKCLFRNSK